MTNCISRVRTFPASAPHAPNPRHSQWLPYRSAQDTFNYEKQSVVLSELSGLQRIEYLTFVQQRTAKFDAGEGELPEAERQIDTALLHAFYRGHKSVQGNRGSLWI